MFADRVPEPSDAYAIWLHARAAVTSAQYPSRLDYTIAVSGLDGATPAADHYRASSDPGEGNVRIFPISDEQLAKPPPVPHGINAGINIAICFGLCIGIRQSLGHPPPYQDLLGEPLLDPTYTFGLRYPHPPETAPTPSPNNGALRVIATVVAQAPDYQVALVGTPMLEGVPTYHLKLTPLRKPKVNRLRELWIGASDYYPRKAILAGNFTLAPLVDVPWTVNFSILNGAPFIARESTPNTLYLPHHRVVREAAIAFEDIRESSDALYDRPLLEPAMTGTALVEPGS